MSRPASRLVVDLVVERAPQLVSERPRIDAISLDPPEEILANKLCALLGRAEIRDLVDVRALEESGLSLESALEAARLKDGGMIPADVLRQYLERLVGRLVALARP